MDLKDDWFRPAVWYLVKVRKMKQYVVANLFGTNRKRVERIIKRFEETGGHKDRSGRGRKRTARSDENVQKARELLEQNNHTKFRNGVTGNSSRKLASKLEISPSSALRILKEDLELTAWNKMERQKLTDDQKRKRLARATVLRDRFADGLHRQILFSDEK